MWDWGVRYRLQALPVGTPPASAEHASRHAPQGMGFCISNIDSSAAFIVQHHDCSTLPSNSQHDSTALPWAAPTVSELHSL